jgi:Protein of unknown function (DUF2891)
LNWSRFEQDRERLLHTLAPPILSAVGNEDTPSPMFHGCFDWHSAVHGVYSLYVLYRRTGCDLYLDAAQQHARPELVEAELDYMRSEEIERQENPYGFAWVLALVRAQENATGGRELRPLGELAATRVRELVETLDADSAVELATRDTHHNLSWALIHLVLWARHTGDTALVASTRRAARDHLQNRRLDDALAVSSDTEDAVEFMAPALMRLAALGDVLEDEANAYVRRRLPPRFAVEPLTHPTTVHAAGVNFFRAFALLHIFHATGLSRLRDNVARLVAYQVGRTDLWRRGDYDRRHWIAQIGVRVIDDSYGDGRRPGSAAGVDEDVSQPCPGGR